jgi:hypothetical protein
MRDLSELNINQGGTPTNRPPPTPAEEEAFERHFGLKLPGSYRALLRFANGGHPALDSIEAMPGSPGDIWSVNAFFYLNQQKEESGNLWKETEKWRKVLGQEALPIANDGGGNVFFIAIGSAGSSVKVCIHDANFAIRDVASSFENFIDRLQENPDYI